MKILLVGQAPGRRIGGDAPLAGRAGRRLAAVMGLTYEEYLRVCDRINLLDSWGGKRGKGDAFNLKDARRRAAQMNLFGYDVVLFIGVAVARVFGEDGPILIWHNTGAQRRIIIPHPSGINRWWNDKANLEQAQLALGELSQPLRNSVDNMLLIYCNAR